MNAARLLLIITAALLLAGVANGLGEHPPASAGTAIDAGRIAFVSPTFSIDAIWPDGTAVTTLVPGPNKHDPGWSPDGRSIAVLNGTSVSVASTDGAGALRPVALGRGKSWSPDGSRIAIIRTDTSSKDIGARDIWLIDVQSGAEQRIVTPGLYFHGLPDWSPDGTKLLFTAGLSPTDTTQNYDVYAMAPDGSGLVNITNSGAVEVEPAWSPDGTQIAFAANDEVRYEIFVTSANGTGRQRVTTHTSDHSFSPSWSPDGSRLAYQHGTNVHTVDATGANDAFLVAGFQPDWGRSPFVQGVEFTQAIQELQSLGGLQDSLGGAAASSGDVGSQAFPGDNGKIAFYSTRPASLQHNLYVMEVDGSNLQFVRNITGTPSSLAWSRDGEQLAFEDGIPSVGFDIFVGEFDGSQLTNVRNVTNSPGPDVLPAWSPDGQKIALAATGAQSLTEVFVVNADGTGNKSQVTTGGGSFPAWSPDGSTIAYARGGVGLFLMSADGTNPRQLTTGNDRWPDWSPNGESIVFTRVVGDEWFLFVVDLANPANPRQLTNNAGFPDGVGDDHPRWSPDGQQIVFGGDRSHDEIWVVNADGSNLHRLTTYTQFGSGGSSVDLSPAWQSLPRPLVAGVEFTQGIQELQSIDALQGSLGRAEARAGVGSQSFPGENGKLAFSMWNGSNYDIHTINQDGSGLDTLIASPAWDKNPAWSADGLMIAFDRTQPGDSIFVAKFDGSEERPVAQGADPSWSPDGERLVFRRGFDDPGLSVVTVGDGATSAGAAVRLTQEDDFDPEWSPDGERIAFCRREPVDDDFRTFLWLINADGSNAHRVNTPAGVICRLTWSPDGTEVAIRGYLNELEGMFVVNVTTGAPRFITNLNVPGTTLCCPGLSWAPDGSVIAFIGPVAGGGDDFVLRTANAQTGAIEPVFQGPSVQDPAWQPIAQLVNSVEFTQGMQDSQTIGGLQADIEGDGMPPVPIVAGKPAAMRIYMSEVEETTVYEIEATGDVNGSRFVQLDPGCTPAERRAHEGVCRSLDFMFTPPQGDWDVTLKVRLQQDSNVLEEHEFNLTSVETVPLIIEPVTVCDHMINETTGVWGCGSLFNFVQNLEFLRATFPGEVMVAGSSSSVYADTDEIPAQGDWWDVIGGNVRALWTADGGFDNVHHFGAVRPEADAETPGGIAYTLANAAAGKTSLLRDDMDGGLPEETADELVAHLLGLNIGLKHAPSTGGCYGTPSEVDPSWPNASPLTEEIGYDVAEEEPVPADHADWMSLCTPRWISPYTANNLIDAFRSGNPRTAQGAGTTVGDFWLIAGTIDEGAGETELDPIFELETEGPTGQGEGLYTIEVRDGADVVLTSRFFKVDETIREDEGELTPGGEDIVRFSELVPVQANAAKIVIFAGAAEVGEIELGGATPIVTLSPPAGAAGGPPLPMFEFNVEDADSSEFTFRLELSRDGGTTWQTVAPQYRESRITLDGDVYGGGSDLVFRVYVSDGVNSSSVMTESFGMQLRPPTGAIVSPTSGASIPQGNLAWLQAAIVDPEDGFLDGGAIEWTSSRDGALGTGASLHVYDLSIGMHTISMMATDTDGFELADSISITVTSGGVFEGEPSALAGDVNCSRAVDSVDGLGISRHVAGLVVSQTQPCPPIGTGAPFGHGDVNCSGEVDAIDALFILRFVAGLPVNLPGGCREIGT